MLPKMKVIFNSFAIRIFTVQHALHMKYILYLFPAVFRRNKFLSTDKKEKKLTEKEKRIPRSCSRLIVSLCLISNDNNRSAWLFLITDKITKVVETEES